jgi:hypothetical protein
MENRLGFQVSPEIVGTQVNPELKGNRSYQDLIKETLEVKGKQPGVLGVSQYLRGIQQFSSFQCHPLLMPVIRPDGRMYYPCLESKHAEVGVLEAGSYAGALREARKRRGEIPGCQDCCHLFCHMALSLLQTHPLSALGEIKHWRN